MEPIKRGVVCQDAETWTAMEHLWRHIFDELNLESKNFNVLMTDSPFNDKKSRSKMA